MWRSFCAARTVRKTPPGTSMTVTFRAGSFQFRHRNTSSHSSNLMRFNISKWAIRTRSPFS